MRKPPGQPDSAPVQIPMLVEEFVELVRKGLTPATARSWSTYLDVIADEFRGRYMHTVMQPEIEAVANKVQAHALRREVSRDGASAKEGFISAARAVWSRAVPKSSLDNPAAGVDKPGRGRARDRRALNTHEIDALWTAIATRTQDPTLGLVVVRLALETGLRRGEMLGLTYGSLERVSGCVRVMKAKNSAVRAQPITATLWDALETLVKERSPSTPKRSTPLLLNRRGVPITGRWFEGVAAKVRDTEPVFGPDGDLWFTWHLTRHTAGKMVERVAGYSVAQKFLGHTPSPLSGTTVLYTEATLDEVRSAVAAIWGEAMAGWSS